MGVALLAAATFMLMRQLSLFPAGSEEIGVRGVELVVAIAGNFLLGALMTLGIGLYAPCMILVSLLGMSERTAFPIMMGSCAFLMPVGSLRFIREQAYSLRNALGLAIGGVAGVLRRRLHRESLDIRTVRWLVIVVVLYTAITMLMAASEQAGRGIRGLNTVQGSGFRVQGSGFRVQGSGFRVQGSGFRVQRFRSSANA